MFLHAVSSRGNSYPAPCAIKAGWALLSALSVSHQQVRNLITFKAECVLYAPHALSLQKLRILAAKHIYVLVFYSFERFALLPTYFSRRTSGNFVGTFRVLKF